MDLATVMKAQLDRVSRFPCTLCGHTPAGGAGYWFPTSGAHKQIIGTPKGKNRVVCYPICPDCSSQPGFAERIERKLCEQMLQKA